MIYERLKVLGLLNETNNVNASVVLEIKIVHSKIIIEKILGLFVKHLRCCHEEKIFMAKYYYYL